VSLPELWRSESADISLCVRIGEAGGMVGGAMNVRAWLATLILFVSATKVFGGPKDETPDTSSDVYVDGTTGFSLRPPNGWQYARERTSEGRGLTVLRMIGAAGPGKWQQIIVRQTAVTKRQPADQTMKQVADAMELEFSNVEIQSQQTQQIAGARGGIISAAYMREGGRKLRIEAFVDAGPRSMLWLAYDGPADKSVGGETIFNEVLGSLELRKPRLNENELSSALDAGSAWLSSLDAKALEPIRNIDQTLRIEADGKAIGYLTLQSSRGQHEGSPGVDLRERVWTFEPEGRVRRVQQNIFISDDLQREKWTSSTTVLVPALGDRQAYFEVALEEGLRTGDLLLSNQTYQINQPEVSNPALKLPNSYMPRAIVRLLPMLGGEVEKPRRMAFTVFDHRIADLVVKIVEFKGRAKRDGDGDDELFRVDEQEGVAGEPSSVYVDKDGAVKFVRSGSFKMSAWKRKDAERQFGDRVAKAQAQMDEMERAYQETGRRFGRQAGQQPPVRQKTKSGR
jgi:hypothetical protein